jgi:hypothetical protein
LTTATAVAGARRVAVPGTSLADALAPLEILQIEVDLPHPRSPVTVPSYVRAELRWKGPLPSTFGSVPNKPAYILDEGPAYPELLVVKLLERGGWGAAWRKNWGGVAYWRDIREPVEPPPMALSIIEQVSRQAGHDLPWEIIAWRGRELRFLVSRTDDGQRVSAYLANWLDAALRMGIPLGCFAIVEHRAERLPRRR